MAKRKLSSTSVDAIFKRVKAATEKKKFKKSAVRVEGYMNGRLTSGTMGPEVKSIDVSTGVLDVIAGSNYLVSALNTIAVGTDDSQRVGQKINVKSISIEANIGCFGGSAISTVAPGGQAFLDVYLVWDKQPDGAAPSGGTATIFSSANTNLTYGLPANLERFQILRRERYAFDTSAGLTARLNWHVPMDMSVRYSDSTGSPNTNNLLLCALSPSAAASGTVMCPNITSYMRVKYTDM